jgi:hypothetical protein
MRCHICDDILSKVVLDERDGKVKPCNACLEVISVAEYERQMEELQKEIDEDEQSGK